MPCLQSPEVRSCSMHRFVAVFRVSCLILLCAFTMFAQRDLSTLAGTVNVTSGGVVANATVKITEQATGLAYQTVTNNVGEFV